MPTKKCQHCKEELINPDEIFTTPKLSKDGIVQKYKNGNTKYNYYHFKCFSLKQKNKNEWNDLYEYIKRTYFCKIVPIKIIMELHLLRNDFEYVIMKECLQEIEVSLKQRTNEINFASDFHKSCYIINAIKNSIDGFYKNRISKNCDLKTNEVDFLILNEKQTLKTNKADDVEAVDLFNFLE